MRHRAINDLDSGLNRQIILAMACYAVTASRCDLLRPTATSTTRPSQRYLEILLRSLIGFGGVGGVVDLAQAINGDVRVHLRGVETGMSQ
jgi:hypothetical protein